MYISDDTTTQINTDFDEDKMQILTGSERLKYFTDTTSELNFEQAKTIRLVSYLSSLFH